MCLYVSTCIYMHLSYIEVYTYVSVNLYKYTLKYAYVRIRVFICKYTCLYLLVCLCISGLIFVDMYAYLYIIAYK